MLLTILIGMSHVYIILKLIAFIAQPFTTVTSFYTTENLRKAIVNTNIEVFLRQKICETLRSCLNAEVYFGRYC